MNRLATVALAALLVAVAFVPAATPTHGGEACPHPRKDDSDHDGLLDAVDSDGVQAESGGGHLHTTDPCDADSDGDGLPDGWEDHYRHRDPSAPGLDPKTADADVDSDGDGLTNLQEHCYRRSDCPVVAAWDGPGEDGEVEPRWASPDGAALNPVEPDTDSDALCDGGGTAACTDVHLDGADVGETDVGTDGRDPDSEGDGMPDGWEEAYGLDAQSASDRTADPDRDSLLDHEDGEVDQPWTNVQEYCYGSEGFDADDDPRNATCAATQESHVRANGVHLGGTDPSDAYTDDDCAGDGWEVYQGYDPTDGTDVCPATDAADQIDEDQCQAASNQTDSDGDGLANGFEDRWASDRCDPDSDGDMLWDDQEWEYGSDPDDPDGDSDEDGIDDRDEVMVHGCDPANADADSDSLLDPDEVAAGTSCARMDTDGDGVPDGTEVHGWRTPEPDDADDEVLVTSDPNVVNSDADSLGDEAEYFRDTDPRSADTDGDGLLDGEEADLDTNPLTSDTDGDGTRDGVDQDTDTGTSASGGSSTQSAGFDPGSLLTAPTYSSSQRQGGSGDEPDADGDGLSDHEEEDWTFTDPYDADSDDDRLSDYEEVRVWNTQPWRRDTDADGIPDMADPAPRGDNTPPAIRNVRARSVCPGDDPGDGDHPEDAYRHPKNKYSWMDDRHVCKDPEEQIVVRAVDRTGVGIDQEMGIQVIDHGSGNGRSCHLDSEDAVVHRRDLDDGVVELRIVFDVWPNDQSLDGECGVRFKVRDHVQSDEPDRVNKVEVIVSHLDGWSEEGLLKPTCVSKMEFAAEYVGMQALQEWATGAWVVVRAADYGEAGLVEVAGKLAMDTVWVLGKLGQTWVKRTGLAFAVEAGVTLMDASARVCDFQDDRNTSSRDVHVNPQEGEHTDRIQAKTPDGGTKDVYLVRPGFHDERSRPDGGNTAHRGAGWERVRDGAPGITTDDVETILESDEPTTAAGGDVWVYSGCVEGDTYEIWVTGRFVYRASGPYDC